MQQQPKIRDLPWTIHKLLKWTDSYFKSHNIENPRASAEIILAYALGLKRIDLYVQYDQPLINEELALFKSLIKRRVKKEPAAYIIGKKEFWSMSLEVTRDVLIPRPETECLVEAALKFLPDNLPNNLSDDLLKNSLHRKKNILELGTGTGAVTIALSSERPFNKYFASDRSQKALEVAKRNVKHHVEKGEISFICGNWLDPIKESSIFFDIILSNPPYIKTNTILELQPEIRKYEPFEALDGDKDGLGPIRNILNTAGTYLADNGVILLEIGYDQKEEVLKIVESCGTYDNFCCFKDYSGNDRVVQIQKKSASAERSV